MKKVLCIFITIVMVLSLAACGSGSSQSSSTASSTTTQAAAAAQQTEPAPEKKIELRLQTPPVFAVGYIDALYDLVERFQADHPNIVINVEELNWDGIGDKLETAMMTGSTPDIYIDGTARTAKLPSTGLVVDVSDVISGLDNWVASATAIGMMDGKHYLVPMTQMPPTVIGINTTLAKQYGAYDLLPEDRVSWEWEDFMNFLRACAEQSVADGVYPIGLYAGNQSSDIAYYSMMLAAGAKVLNEDHTAAAVNSEQAVAVVNYLKQMADEGLAYPGAATMGDEEEEALFFSNKTIVSLSTNGALSVFPVVEEMKNEGIIEETSDFEAYGYPHLNGSATVNATWGANCIAIFENEGDADKIAAAKEFVSFMMDDLSFSETMWLSSPSYAPTRNLGQQLRTDDPRILREAEVNNMLGSFNDSSFGILEPFWAEIRQHFYPELQSMFNGNQTAEDVISNFENSINSVITGY